MPLLYVFEVLTWRQAQVIVLSAMAVATVLEGLRLSGYLDWWVYRTFTREYEQHWPAGYALALFGASVTVLVFEPRVAVPALLMLTIGDPVSGILGGNTLEVKEGYVLLVTFGICLSIAGLLAVPTGAAVLGAGAATIADGTTPSVRGYVIDDNLTIPIVAASAMSIGLALF